MENTNEKYLIDLIKYELKHRKCYYPASSYAEIYESFMNHFPLFKVKDLESIHVKLDSPGDPRIMFVLRSDLFESKQIYFSNDLECKNYVSDPCDCCYWKEVDRAILTKNEITKSPKFNSNDIPNVIGDFKIVKSIVLYPFNSDILSLEELNLGNNLCNLDREEDEWYNKTVRIDNILFWMGHCHEYNGVVYKVFVDGKLDVELIDENTTYQEGDDYTKFYYDENTKSVIIENYGDVSSVVVINF